MSADPFQSHASSLSGPPTRLLAVTPDDSADLPFVIRGLMVAAPGDVAVVTVGGDTGVLPALNPGVQYPIRARRVLAAGSNATGIAGLA